MTIAIVSILAITLMTWLANKVLPFTVCPICAGVFLTWTGLVSAHLLGYQVDLVIPALLMGGSVVGIAYQLEKRAFGRSSDARMFFKMLFMPAGFIAMYAVLEGLWFVFAGALAVLAVVSFVLLSKRARHAEAPLRLEKELEKCC